MPCELFVHSISGLPRWSIQYDSGRGSHDPEPEQTFFVSAVGYTFQPTLEKVLAKLPKVTGQPAECFQVTSHEKRTPMRDRDFTEPGFHVRFLPKGEGSFLELLPPLIALLEKTYKVDQRFSQSNPYTGR